MKKRERKVGGRCKHGHVFKTPDDWNQKDGRCKECNRISAAKRRHENPEAVRRAARDYQRRKAAERRIEALTRGDDRKSPERAEKLTERHYYGKAAQARNRLDFSIGPQKSPRAVASAITKDEFERSGEKDRHRKAITAFVRILAYLIAELDRDNDLILMLKHQNAPEHSIDLIELALESANIFTRDHLFFNGRRLNENGEINLALFESFLGMLTRRVHESQAQIRKDANAEPQERKGTTSLSGEVLIHINNQS